MTEQNKTLGWVQDDRDVEAREAAAAPQPASSAGFTPVVSDKSAVQWAVVAMHRHWSALGDSLDAHDEFTTAMHRTLDEFACIAQPAPATGDEPKSQQELDKEADAAIVAAFHRAAKIEPSQPLDMVSSGGEREAFEAAYSAMMNAQSIAERWGVPSYTPAEIRGMRVGDVYLEGAHVLNGGWLLWQASAAHRREDQRDAERWRTVLRFVGARNGNNDGQVFYISGILRAHVNLMKGSVAQHFTDVIDAAMQRTAAPAHGENGVGGEGVA